VTGNIEENEGKKKNIMQN